MIQPRKTIKNIKPYIPGISVREIKIWNSLSEIVKLNSNENPFGVSKMVKEALEKSLDSVYLYPNGPSSDLKTAISTKYVVAPNQILIGNGSDELIMMVTSTFLNPGEKVLISENTFSEYEFASRIFDGEIVKIPTKEYGYDLENFLVQLDVNVKIIFLCNPNNPTGLYFTQGELQSFLEKVPATVLVVLDEAYGDYAIAKDFPRGVSLLDQYPNLVVLKTFSKLYGLAGLRVGFAIGNKDIISEIEKTKLPFNVNAFAQVAAKASLEDIDFVNKSIENNTRGICFLEKELSSMGVDYLPTQANFICFKTRKPAAGLCDALNKIGIIIRPLKSFGLEYWSRVTIGTDEQNKKFVAGLRTLI